MSPVTDGKPTLSQRAYEHLRERIVQGELRPGDRVSLRSAAKTLGMSMAPVGEALRELARDGLMELDPGWGARVRRVDIDMIRDQHILRTAIECEAARHCCRMATDEELTELMELALELDRRIDSEADPEQIYKLDSALHLRIAELSRVPSLVEVLKTTQLVRMLARGSILAHKQSKPVLQHVQLVEAIRTRNADEAEKALREHCFRSMQLQLSAMAMGGLEL